ncbi:TetR family transcriptional regulator [Aquicoccus sp. SCR17]|nr:TetR family transcriptional regulator [Carideicomes alvinocaridis]
MNVTMQPIRRGRKFAQVLEGARKVFLRDGFGVASVDDIAREAGVSKATLYAYFPDKQSLFFEVARQECEKMAQETLARIDQNAPPAQVLPEVARSLTRFLVSGFAQRVFRICVAEADRFPELGRHFYACGPELGRERTKAYLAAARDRGELRVEDLDLAAEQFGELCKATLWAKSIFGVKTSFSEAEIDRAARGAVETFLARYGAAQTDRD